MILIIADVMGGINMHEDYITQFYMKLCDLQDEYGIYIDAEYDEDWDYDINDEPYLYGVNAYVSFVDKNDCEVAKIYKNPYAGYEKFFTINNKE